MIRLAGPLFVLAFAFANAQANAGAMLSPPASQHEAEQPASGGPQPPSAEPSAAIEVCRTLEQVAAGNALPVGFFVRVIWQESRFNARAVSPKGAAGIAQFMPRTADWRGLSNPFDVISALKASGSYLRDLRNRFGNLGLAAAAYNAGPQRVQDWLVARSSLPKETRRYVEIVTGHSAAEWSGGTTQPDLALPESVPCLELARSIEPRTAAKSDIGHHDGSTGSGPASKPGWGVQLASETQGARWRVGSISYTHQGATFMALEVVFIESCLPDMDPGRLDMARVRHYRDLIRGGGTLAPIHVSSDDVVLDGHHRLAALAAEGVSSVAAVRIDRVMRRKPAMLTYDDLIDSRDQPRADRFRRQR